MIYRNVKTGAVINTPCKISGKDWQEASSAGYPLGKKEYKTPEVIAEEPAKKKTEAAEADGSERKQAKTEEKKAPAKGAVIRPKKVK